MKQSYESYSAECHAQLVTPASRDAWERDCALASPHTVDFTVTPEMAEHGQLAVGSYRNHFGHNQTLIKTERIK